MQPNPNRRPKIDIFGGVEDVRPEELRAARVISNLEVSEHRKSKSKSGKRVEIESAPESVDALDGHVVTQLLKEVSYLPEAEDGVANVLPKEEPTSENSDNPLVRILDNFLIFDSHSFALVPLSSLWEIDTPCEACGDATGDGDEEREFSLFDGIPLRTSTIMSYSMDIHQEYRYSIFANFDQLTIYE